MSPDEEKMLASLLAQKKREDDGNTVIQLLPGGRQDDTPLVEKLRGLVTQAKNGEFEEFVFVAIRPKQNLASSVQDATISWSGPSSFAMTGALAKAFAFFTK